MLFILKLLVGKRKCYAIAIKGMRELKAEGIIDEQLFNTIEKELKKEYKIKY